MRIKSKPFKWPAPFHKNRFANKGIIHRVRPLRILLGYWPIANHLSNSYSLFHAPTKDRKCILGFLFLKAYYMCHMNTLITLLLSLKQVILVAYGVYLLLISVITFIAYHSDKKKAKKGEFRIKESVLLLLSLLGGAFGGYPAMLIFRHKTKGEHWYFTFVNLLGIAIPVALFLLILFIFNF